MPTVYSPPVNTFTPLATITLPSATNTVDFTSIPSSGYRDLVLHIEGSATAGGAGFRLQLNDDGSAIYNQVLMRGSGSTPISNSAANQAQFLPSDAGLTTARFMSVIQIMDYNDSKHKTLLVRTDTSGSNVETFAMRYASTSTISQVNVFLSSQNFSAGTTMSLYGIAS